MNLKLIFRTLIIVLVLSTLVILGMTNRQDVDLRLPKFLFPSLRYVTMPAAYMYFIFMGVGMIVGALLMTGGGKSGGSKKSDK